MLKGSKFGICQNQFCGTVGACSPKVSAAPVRYYCQNCAKALNDAAIGRGQPPPCVLRPNQFR